MKVSKHSSREEKKESRGDSIYDQTTKDIARKEYQNKKRRRSCTQNVVQKRGNHGSSSVSIKGKAQQSSTQTEVPKGTAKEKNNQRNIRRIFKMLRKVQLNIGIEKVDMYKDIGNVYEQKNNSKK